MTTPMPARINRYVPLILALLFITPMMAAWYLYYHTAVFREQTINRGELITPPRALAVLTFEPALEHYHRPRWRLLYVLTKACEQSCQDVLYRTRQMHIALGKHQNQLLRTLVTFQGHPSVPETLLHAYPGIHAVQVAPAQWARFTTGLSHSNTSALYLVDPENRVMMRYAVSAPPGDIYQDLKRLLKARQVD